MIAQGFGQEVLELFQQIWGILKQDLHLRINRILDQMELTNLDQNNSERQTHVMGVPLFFLVCLQDLQKGLVCSLIVSVT